MNTKTRSEVTHRTFCTSEVKKNDGGRSLLLETFDFIHQEHQVGKLEAQFGTGGAISSLVFVETKNVIKDDLEVIPEDQQ